MTSRDFCYWLQGYFEINDNQPRPPEYAESLNSSQIKIIKQHLNYVFDEIGRQQNPLAGIPSPTLDPRKTLFSEGLLRDGIPPSGAVC